MTIPGLNTSRHNGYNQLVTNHFINGTFVALTTIASYITLAIDGYILFKQISTN
jgi:hypothetical protein